MARRIHPDRALELSESRGGRPGLPVPNNPYGLCCRVATVNLNILSVESQASGEHCVASSRGVQPASPTRGWPQGVASRDWKASCGLDFSLGRMW